MKSDWAPPRTADTSWRAHWRDAVNSFFFAPASPLPLAVLRIGLSAVLLLQAGLLASRFAEFYASTGILQNALPEGWPPAGIQFWLWLATKAGWNETLVLDAVGLVYLASLLSLFLGWKTRIAAGLTWFFHMLLTNGQVTAYGLDTFSHSVLFLLIWMPCGAAWSLDRFFSVAPAQPLPSARLSLRVLQIFLCIAYFASGMEKALGSQQWWNGEAIWRALMLPTFSQFDLSWMARVPWTAKLACWYTLLVESGYPFFIWPLRTRPIWIAAVFGLHAGIGVFLGLRLFALVMIVLTGSIFGVSAEPSRRRSLAQNYKQISQNRSRISSQAQAL